MNKFKLKKIQELLEHTNKSLGETLGYSIYLNQCKQIENLLSGKSKVTPILLIALECLARRSNKLKEFNEIINTSDQDE